jgi:formiminotetrahydrofolate cyclodeaminase
MSLTELTLNDYLAKTAARTPAPGGGAAAAITGATAAALTEMAAAFAPDEKIAARAGELRARLLALADEDLSAYEPVLEALRGDRTTLPGALSAAAEPPRAISEAAAEVAALAREIGPRNPGLVGDADAAVALAEAAARAADRLVELNLSAAAAARSG